MHEESKLELRLTTQWYTSRSRCVPGSRKSGRSRNVKLSPETKAGRYSDDGVVVRTDKLLRACYAMHPTVQEIVDAVDYLKPKIVTPLVKPFNATLRDVKEALQANCTHSFVYNDYRTGPPEHISPLGQGHKGAVETVRSFPPVPQAATDVEMCGSSSTFSPCIPLEEGGKNLSKLLSSPVPFKAYQRPQPFFDSPPPFSPESIGTRMSQGQNSDTDISDCRWESSPSPSPVKIKKKTVLRKHPAVYRNREGGSGDAQKSPNSSTRRSLFNIDASPMRFNKILWKDKKEEATTTTSDGSITIAAEEAAQVTIDDEGSEGASTTDFEEVASNASNSQSQSLAASSQHDF